MTKSRVIAIGLALTILSDTAMQLLWKYAVATLPATGELGALVQAALHQPWFLALAAVGFFQLANWLVVLERAELSYAKPISAMSYATVCVTSAWLFKEHISIFKIMGVTLILAGVWLLCNSTAQKPSI